LSPATPQDADQLRGFLQNWALPQRQLSAPMSVVYGTDDQYIDAQWTTSAISRACALGGTVESDLEPGKDHVNLDIDGQLQWLAERFEDKPVQAGCLRGSHAEAAGMSR
jgi:dienelactone hydrolase